MHQFIATPLDFIMLGGILLLSIFVDFKGHSDNHEMGFKEASMWFIFWFAVAIAYGGYLFISHGSDASSLYFSGYALEKALSVDNLMVMMAIFTSFGIKSGAAKHRVLLWGIAGALVFRGIFVAAGTALFNLHWSVQVIFGLIVAWSAMAIFKGEDEDEEVDYTKHWAIKPLRKFMPITTELNECRFTKVVDGVKMLTPVFVCMVVVELSDIMFSFDSVPAVIGVTKEPLLVYAAMIMAILGLRSLFFVLESLMKYLKHLDTSVGIILVFVGAKLILGAFGWHISANTSLAVVLSLLAGGVFASLVDRRKS